jgi:hypothetical protein
LPHATAIAFIRSSTRPNPFLTILPTMKSRPNSLSFSNSIMPRALILGIALLLPQAFAKSAAEQAGMAPGTVHKVGVGLGVAKFRVIKMGEDGWVMVECREDNNAGWKTGEKYWLNTNSVVFISAPFQTGDKPADVTPAMSPPAKPAAKAP